MNYTMYKEHTIANGQKFALWGKLETPQGTFYLAPEFPNQQALTATGSFFCEGVKYIYADPELKKRIGRLFGEHVVIPNKAFNMVRQAPKRANARPLTGGLPPLPEDAATPVYPEHAIKNVDVKFA